MNFMKRFGKMWLIVSIIAAYWMVFAPRQKTLQNYQFLNSVEDIEMNILNDRRQAGKNNVKSFVIQYFKNLKESDIYKENVAFRKMAIFQDRYEKSTCITYNSITSQFLKNHSTSIQCYDPKELTKLSYGDYTDGFEYQKLKGVKFNIGGRKFSTKNGFYYFLNARDLEESKDIVMEKIKSGWVDQYTKYVGIVINFYDPIFRIMMYYAVFYDFRFGFNELVSQFPPLSFTLE